MGETIHYQDEIRPEDLFHKKDDIVILQNVSSNECLRVEETEVFVEGGKYTKGFYVDIPCANGSFRLVENRPDIFHPIFANIHASGAEIELIRCGPWGQAWISGKFNNRTKINRLLVEGNVKRCSLVDINLLNILERGYVVLEKDTSVKTINVFGGGMLIVNDSSVRFESLILHPGGIVKIKEDEMHIHLDIMTEKRVYLQAQTTIGFDKYTIFYG